MTEDTVDLVDALPAVLEATRRIRARSFPGSSTDDGKLYHDLPWITRSRLPAHRPGTAARVGQLIERLGGVRDKRILDVGCSAGGISLGLAMAGAEVLGVDRDVQSLAVARAAQRYLQIPENRLRFDADVVSRQWVRELGSFDVVVWLSGFMWIRKEQGHEEALEILFELSKRTDTLVLESAAADGEAAIPGATQTTIREWIGAGAAQPRLSSVPSPKGWFDRRVFFAKGGPRLEWEGDTAQIKRLSRGLVCKTFRPAYCWMVEREVKALQRLQDSRYAPDLIDFDRKSVQMSFAGWPRDVSADVVARDRQPLLGDLARARIRHRDLRPSNLLGLGGHLVAIDFGWALFDDETQAPRPDRLELNDREDGRGKWGGRELDDVQALEEIEQWMRQKGR